MLTALRFPLLRWISLRHLFDEPGRTLLTLSGVALGVAVYLAIRLANASALASFSATVDAVAGRANLQVTGGSGGFDERLFLQVRRAPGVQAAAPVVQIAAPSPTLGGETVMVLGLDLFSEAGFGRVPASGGQRAESKEPGAESSASRAASKPAAALSPPSPNIGRGAGGEGRASDSATWLHFLADPGAVAITRSLARRHGLKEGSELVLTAAARRVPFQVWAVLDSEELEQAFGGSLAIMDIGVAQDAFARLGRLDRIDLLMPERERETVAKRLSAALPPDVRVARPESRGQAVANMLTAFQLNLTALSFIALFVSLFLVFNALSMAVIKRRREIGILRSLGVRRGEVLRLFLAEALFFGAVGTLLGVALGILLARGALGAVSQTISQLYVLVEARTLRLSPEVLLQGAAIGFGAAVLAALVPALEASRTPAGVTMRQGALIEVRPVALGPWLAAGVALLVVAGVAAALGLWLRQPIWGFVSAIGVLAGFSALTPAGTVLLNGALDRPMRRLFGAEGHLAVRYLTESLARTAVIVASLMVAMAMLISLSVMVSSFRGTVDTWVTQTIKADLYVEPAGRHISGAAAVLPAPVIETARSLPGVAAVDTYHGVTITFRGREVWLASVRLDVLADYSHQLFQRGSSREILRRARAQQGAVVTESFSRHFRVRAGDTITLDTPTGPRRLPIVGVFYDYSTDQGAILMDRDLYRRWYRDPILNSMALYLKPGTDPLSTRAEMLRRLGGRYALIVSPNQTLRRHVLDVFDQTFRITYALQVIAVLVAALGIINTLTALILQRGREIGILRAIGAFRSQVRRIVLIEAGLIGLTGYVIGSLCGLTLAALLVFVINRQFFGWSIRMVLEPAIFLQAFALVAVTSLLAGLWPARHAASRAPAEAMRLD
jgi:putative ABC transport system permease protein